MDINPDEATQYLEGVDYPASKEDLASAAEGRCPGGTAAEDCTGRTTFSVTKRCSRLESSPTRETPSETKTCSS